VVLHVDLRREGELVIVEMLLQLGRERQKRRSP